MFRHIPFIDKKNRQFGEMATWGCYSSVWLAFRRILGQLDTSLKVRATEKDIYGNSKTSLDLKFMIQR